MIVEQLFEKAAHIGVRGMHLVDHEQAARERGGADGRVLDAERAEQRLVDRADRHARGKEAVGSLRRPAAVGVAVVPADLPAGERLTLGVAGAEIAGNRENRLRRVRAP